MNMNYRSDAHISGGSRDLSEYIEAVRYVHRRDAGLLPAGHPPHPSAGDLWGLTSAVEIARTWCDVNGISTNGQAKADVLTTALAASREISEGRRDGHGTSTFAGIVSNLAFGNTLLGWNLIRHTWRDLCRVAIVDDFRRSNRAGADEMTLAPVGERGQIQTSPMDDRVEYAVPVSYAGLLPISRPTLLADDRKALVIDPLKLGSTASGRVNTALFDVLAMASAAGPTLNATGRALFNTTDATLAGSGGALTVTTLGAGRAAMQNQRDASSRRRLNISPTYLLAAPAIGSAARVLAASEHMADDPANLRVLSDGALTDISTTAWYLFADPNQHDTFEVAFVGQAEPEIDTRPAFEFDGLSTKVRIDFVVTALDYRGVYRNRGA